MILKNWDPLETGLSSEVVEAAKKREIRNILKSYTGWYDPLCELIQNALDAVDERRRSDKSFKPEIWIKIDLKEKAISVTDNGIGFSRDEFLSFLAPNVSFKKQRNRGYKGVGATYLAYGFNFLQVGTKTPGFQYVGVIKDGREWVEDDKASNRPVVNEAKALHEVFKDIDRGSTFTLKLTGDFIHPKDLNWIGATRADQWDVVLRIKTPLGGIYIDTEGSDAKCHLKVVDENGVGTEIDIDRCEYVWPHTVISSNKELRELKNVRLQLVNKGLDDSKLPDKYRQLNGLYNFWKCDDIVSRNGTFAGEFSKEEKAVAEKYKIGVYGYFGCSTDIWDKYNDDTVKLRKGQRILKGGLQLAANCMPQGDLLAIPLTKNTWYQNVTHIVVHFEGAEPDLGRKGFQPELKDLAEHIASAAVKQFQGSRRSLKADTGAPPDIQSAREVYDWIKEQEEHERKHRLIINRQDVFLPMKEPALTSEPLNEQDVISLFNQLLAGGVIRGVRLMATSQHQQYDGIFRFYLKEPFENHVFHKKTNPLGILEDQIKKEFESAPTVLEYKYSFDGLFEEIEKGEKKASQIGMVVAWQMGQKWKGRYEVTPLLHFDNVQHRYFHGGTHIVKDSSTGEKVFPAIILKELVEYLNNPDGIQNKLEEMYVT